MQHPPKIRQQICLDHDLYVWLVEETSGTDTTISKKLNEILYIYKRTINNAVNMYKIEEEKKKEEIRKRLFEQADGYRKQIIKPAELDPKIEKKI